MPRKATQSKAVATNKKVTRKKTANAKSKAMISAASWSKAISRSGKEKREQDVAGDFISIRNGKFTFKGKNIGTSMDVIILDYAFIRQWFDVPFDPDNPSIPACYSIQYVADGMRPADNAVKPQCDGECHECEYDAWGSDEKGDGKACKEGRRLACMSADKDLTKADIGFVNIPSASLKDWRGFVSDVEDKLGKEVFAVVTRISFDDDSDFVKLKFDIIDQIDDPAEGTIILEARDNINAQLLEGFDPSNYHEPVPKKKTRAKKRATTKKKVTRAKSSRRA